MFVNPTVDPRPMTSAEERKDKLMKVILPRSDSPRMERSPKYSLTRLLFAAIWLCFCCKFLNEGTAKEACQKFEVRLKQLSKILSGSKYKEGTDTKKEQKGPKARGKKHKSVHSHVTVKEPEDEGNGGETSAKKSN